MIRVATLLTAVLVALGAPAHADDYPSKPIHVLTRARAGRHSDTLGRARRGKPPKAPPPPLDRPPPPGGPGNHPPPPLQGPPRVCKNFLKKNPSPNTKNQPPLKNFFFHPQK